MKKFLKITTLDNRSKLIEFSLLKDYHITDVINKYQDELGDENSWLKEAVKLTNKLFINEKYILKWVDTNLEYVLEYINTVQGWLIHDVISLEIIHEEE